MTNRYFSSSQLYALRNEINVQILIEKTLRVPCRLTKGCFRFLCPLCNGFDTAVNPKTNLARCFGCRKNFNAIDLVMLTRQADFVRSVKFLQSIYQKDDRSQNHHDPVTKSAGNLQTKYPAAQKTSPEKSNNRPHPIGEILDGVLSPIHEGISEKSFDESKSNIPTVASQITEDDRLLKIEQKLQFLDRQVKKIAQILNVGLSSK